MSLKLTRGIIKLLNVRCSCGAEMKQYIIHQDNRIKKLEKDKHKLSERLRKLEATVKYNILPTYNL